MASPFFALMAKELLSERRNPELLSTMALLSVAVISIMAFATSRPDPSMASSSLWISLTLSAVLATSRLYQKEHETGTLKALMASPISPSSVYLAKTSVLAIFLLINASFSLLLCILLFGARFDQRPDLLLGVLAAGIIGLSAVASLLGGLSGPRSGELMLAVALMPLMVPLIIAASRATEALVASGPSIARAIFWITFLAGFDLLVLIVSLWSFEPLMRR